MKLVHDYSKYVYLYGHKYRGDYQNQVDNSGIINVYYHLQPDEIYKFIGLATLSGVLGNLAWAVVKCAAQKIVSDFNRTFNKDCKISEQELYDIFKSFEIFLKHSDQIDKKVMDGIMEEIFAHESGKHGKTMAENGLKSMIAKISAEKERLKRKTQN